MNFIERSHRGATIRPTACTADAGGILRRLLLAATILAPIALTGGAVARAADTPPAPATPPAPPAPPVPPAPPGAAVSTGSALLIGNGRSVSLPGLPDCEPALRDLGDRLRGQGDDVTEVMDAPGPALRAAIGRFAADLSLSGQVVVAYCGYAMADADKLFLLPADAAIAQAADLPRQAVIARTVSRILARHPSLFVAELHVPPGNAKEVDLASGIQSLREETAPGTHLAVTVEPAAAGAPLIGAFATAVSSSKDWRSFSGPAPGATTPPAAPAPAAAADTNSASTAPSGPAPDAPPAAAPATPDHAAGPEGAPAAGTAPDAAGPATPAAAADAPAATAGTAADAGAVAGTAGGSPPAGPGTPAAAGTPAPGTPAAVAAAHPAAGAAGSKPISLLPPRKPHVKPPVPVDDGGSPTIRRIQVALVARGLMHGEITGHTDAETQHAVSTYQKSLGHPATGFLTYQEISGLEPHK